MAIRLVIADDHPIVLRGLQELFAQHDDIAIVASCVSGGEAIEAVERDRPDVLLLDLKMSGVSGLDVLRRLRDLGLPCRPVVLTAAASDDEVAEALDLGAAGLVFKDSSPASVVESVRQVAKGQSWIDRETLTRALASGRRTRGTRATPETTLTPRELELIKLVAEGLRNKEIGSRLAITEGTVKIHLHNIYDKLGVDGRLELVLAAQHKQLI
jgi:DNA-binding NarL/FixJ family response regulator